MDELKQKIKELAEKYSSILNNKIEGRKEEMKADDNSHYTIVQSSRYYHWRRLTYWRGAFQIVA